MANACRNSEVYFCMPVIKIGERRLRHVTLRIPNCQNRHFDILSEEISVDSCTEILLFLGIDVIEGSSIANKNRARVHARYAKEGLATKLSFNGVKINGIANSSNLWFYNIQGLFKVTFEYLGRSAQRDCLRHFTNLWLDSSEDAPLEDHLEFSIVDDGLFAENKRGRISPESRTFCTSSCQVLEASTVLLNKEQRVSQEGSNKRSSFEDFGGRSVCEKQNCDVSNVNLVLKANSKGVYYASSPLTFGGNDGCDNSSVACRGKEVLLQNIVSSTVRQVNLDDDSSLEMNDPCQTTTVTQETVGGFNRSTVHKLTSVDKSVHFQDTACEDATSGSTDADSDRCKYPGSMKSVCHCMCHKNTPLSAVDSGSRLVVPVNADVKQCPGLIMPENESSKHSKSIECANVKHDTAILCDDDKSADTEQYSVIICEDNESNTMKQHTGIFCEVNACANDQQQAAGSSDENECDKIPKHTLLLCDGEPSVSCQNSKRAIIRERGASRSSKDSECLLNDDKAIQENVLEILTFINALSYRHNSASDIFFQRLKAVINLVRYDFSGHDDPAFPYEIIDHYTTIITDRASCRRYANTFGIPVKKNIALCALSERLGQEFNDLGNEITMKVEAFKLRHIDCIDDIPQSERVVQELFPNCMTHLLLNWMNHDNKLSSLGQTGCSDHEYSPPSKKSCISINQGIDSIESVRLFPFVQLMLEFTNNVLISGVAHVVYSRLRHS